MLNKLKWNGACFGLCLASVMLSSRPAKAEISLFEKDGWTFSFEGRVNSFLSAGKGDDFPRPTPGADPMAPPHTVMGFGGDQGNGRPDVGWPGSYQEDVNNKYLAARVRSGMFGNILGFALTRQLTETTTIRGYISMWSTVESLGRDKWAPLNAEAREGYFVATGNWGNITVGRMLTQLGRTSYEIDVAYGHGYGLGLPCTDALGPACGHIGTGALFPGYSAGMSYTTPSLGGLQLNVGFYDPAAFSTSLNDWSHASFVRPEGALTYKKAVGESFKIKLGLEGVYQPVARLRADPTTMVNSTVTTAIWGASGGARVEIGPVRLGLSGFRGHGTGLYNALQKSKATSDNDTGASAATGLTYDLRTFTGYYGQGALVFGKWHVAGGYGLAMVDQLPVDKINDKLSVIQYQAGMSAAVYYRVADSVVLGLDWFRFMAKWYGAPVRDPVSMELTGAKLTGEQQVLDFVNLGVTYRW